ncbi:MAG: hypothetical protein ABIW19_08340 [Vicinamibacterales bacterium]
MAHQRRAADKRQLKNKVLIAGVAAGALFTVAALLFFAGTFHSAVARDGAPSWAPDSQTLIFTSEVDEGPSAMFTMQRDGSRRRRLGERRDRERNPAYSPDGTAVAFDSEADGNSEIYVMNADGSHVRRLTSNPAADMAPAWSSDGTRLAFMSDRGSRAGTDIYTMRADDGSQLVRVTNDQTNWAPQYSPDGRQLAVQINRDVSVVDLSSGTRRRLTAEPLNGMNPTWSPDGQRIAFVTTRRAQAEIFTMASDGSNQQLLVSMASGSVIDPRWSPDGRQIAFVLLPGQAVPGAKPERQAIYTIELASSRITRLSP